MEIAKRKAISLQLNIAPLIDIVFLLLIFFMLTSTFMKERAIDLALPESDSTELVADEMTRLSVTKENAFFLNGEKVEKDRLPAALERLRAQSPGKNEAVVEIAETADVQLLVTAMDLLQNAGFTDIALATDGATPALQK